MVTIYGIRQCDTMKKARGWLDAAGIAYEFYDYKVSGIDRTCLLAWCLKLGWERVMNRAGTTFRKLPDVERQDLNLERAVDLMLRQPSMIKRPLLDIDGRLLLGFTPDTYAAALRGVA